MRPGRSHGAHVIASGQHPGQAPGLPSTGVRTRGRWTRRRSSHTSRNRADPRHARRRNHLRTDSGRTGKARAPIRNRARAESTGGRPLTDATEHEDLVRRLGGAVSAANLGAGLNHARPISRSQTVGSGHAAFSVAKQQPPIRLCQDRLRAPGVPNHDRLGSPGQVPATYGGKRFTTVDGITDDAFGARRPVRQSAT